MTVKEATKDKASEEKGEAVATSVSPTELSTQDAPAKKAEEDTEPQVYVHLADGSVIRCKEKDLPEGSTAESPSGHWQRGNKVYLVVAVYPVEVTVKEEKE
jgi:hypothetical protein